MPAHTKKPHRSIRRAGVAVALVAALALLSACLSPSQSQVQSELNSDRRAHGLSTLGVNADAQAKAQAWAEKLARENTLYHSNLPDGIRTRWCSLGENVGYGPNVPTIEDAYMNSTGHRANILSTKWNGVGVGYATNGNRVFTVQVFIKTC
ncbi:CAP domain-containing protein [Aquihabitans sp. G128]|uniref:CAP domain-containing protein n=1 Tax=Aquihabitans sp. G128 TaxID=2849779 RepID=UPI001C221C6F|nr:CAP domain-containing protein [Aquihabitans sp. G128]QXC63258.1 CAP domain-containing protein [Aquihabitans sp. G128]